MNAFDAARVVQELPTIDLALTDLTGRTLLLRRRIPGGQYELSADTGAFQLSAAHVHALRGFLHTDEPGASDGDDLIAVLCRDLAHLTELRRDLETLIGRGQEEMLREIGRQRSRAEAAEAVLHRLLGDGVEAVDPPGTVLYEARELLGMDGRTGWPRDQAEAGRG